MKRRILLFALLSACAEDGLRVEAPLLTITVVRSSDYAAYEDGQLPRIDLGAVPVGHTRVALFELSNPSTVELEVSGVRLVDTAGKLWTALPLDPPSGRIKPLHTARLSVAYQPDDVGRADGTFVEITSDAHDGAVRRVQVNGSGVLADGADIEIRYDGGDGPAPGDCSTSATCVVPEARALAIGNIGLGQSGTGELAIRNTATCPQLATVGCDTCSLALVRLAFKAGTNDQGLFSLPSPPALPQDLRQRDVGCGASGEIRLRVSFAAPTTSGTHRAVLVIESDDPDERVIELPVTAQAIDGPVAIAKLREFNAARPSDPWTAADDIEPLDTVYLDGASSYDPRDPSDSSLLSTWTWEVIEYPDGASPADFALTGQGTRYASIWLPLAGRYVVRLRVRNDVGLTSGDTEQSRVVFEATPGSRIHVQLVWDNPTNDIDLHLVNPSIDPRLCSSQGDCYWVNQQPSWYPGSVGDGPNPSLDIDDINGMGPENINIDAPRATSYNVYAHYWWDEQSSPDTSPTWVTVRVYLSGLLRAEVRRQLSVHEVWSVGEIVWQATNSGLFNETAADVAGEHGRVASIGTSLSACVPPGWTFP